MIRLSPANRFFLSTFCASKKDAVRLIRAFDREMFDEGSSNRLNMSWRDRFLLVFMTGAVRNPGVFILGIPVAFILYCTVFINILRKVFG